MGGALTQIGLLIGGAFLGLLLALLVQPLLQDKAEVFLVRVAGSSLIRRKESLAGEWRFVWTKEGLTLDRSEETSLSLSVAGKRVGGRFSWRGRDYWLLGRRETDQFISGTYLDERAGLTFHGAFHLKVNPNEETMAGQWMGFNAQHEIVRGPWEWRRPRITRYPFELAQGREHSATPAT